MKKFLYRLLVRGLLLAGAPLLPTAPAASAQSFAKGADIGWLQQMEANGYKFYDEQGVPQDCFALLKANGINAVRLRVWVNPSLVDWVNGHCSPAEVVTMATRAQAAGLRVMIDFHYSDSWADPGQQTKPAAWAQHSFSQLLTDVYDHTAGVMNALKAKGVTPEWVQVGNEITNGLLWPEGSTANFNQLTQLLNQGYAAVKASSPTTQVVIHLDKGHDNARFRSFFDRLQANGGQYDVIGLSYYPYWLNQDYTVSLSGLQFNLTDLASRYGKPVVVAEIGGDCANAPQNVYDMLVAVQNAVAGVPKGQGLGVFYWEPQGYRRFSGYQLSAFSNEGKPSTALKAFLVTPTAPVPEPTGTNLLANPGFEANAAATQTPTGWSSGATTPANLAADYAEAGGHTGNYRLTHWLAAAYQASTFQRVTNLPAGTYTLRAWVRSGGGQTACWLYAKNFGGPEKTVALPVADTWVRVQLTNIEVSNGQCEIGLWSDARAGNWCSLDDVAFFRNTTVTSTHPAAPGPLQQQAAPMPYPNPVQDVLLLPQAGKTGAGTVRVFSITGKLMLSQPVSGNAAPLAVPVARLAAGLYLLEVESGGIRNHYRFVKH